MSRRTRVMLGLALITLAAAAGFVVAGRGTRDGRPSSASATAAPLPDGARLLGRITHGTVRFALNLRLHEHALNEYLRHVRPGAAERGRLTAAAFGTRFGLSDTHLAQLRTRLGRLGIGVERVYPQRTAMLVRGSVSQLEQLFALRFDRYRLPDGRRYYAPEQPPRIPTALAPYVTGLGDLSDRPLLRNDIPASGLTPSITAQAYGIKPLWDRGFRGKGETIAIATAFGAINPADIQMYAAKNGIPNPQIEIRPVDGGSHYSRAQGSDTEVDLDLEIVLGLVPEAHIIDYQGNGNARHTLADIYNQIEQDGAARIVTTSYGMCEYVATKFNPGEQQLTDNSLKALEASGVTVFESTGDSGAYACLQRLQIQPGTTLPKDYTELGVQTPSSTPYAVAVGGTRLDLRSDGSYLDESAWSNPLERIGAGGGVSATEPRPSWQRGPGVAQPALNPQGRRQTPDVSGPADPFSGFMVCGTDPGASSPRCHGAQGGTSAAAPFWAASLVLVQQYAAGHGAGALAHCFAGPILYDLAATPQPLPPYHQIKYGNNGYYPATGGWSFAAGLGSPNVFNLAQDYAAFLRQQSSKQCPF
jgi:kumamolisin